MRTNIAALFAFSCVMVATAGRATSQEPLSEASFTRLVKESKGSVQFKGGKMVKLSLRGSNNADKILGGLPDYKTIESLVIGSGAFKNGELKFLARFENLKFLILNTASLTDENAGFIADLKSLEDLVLGYAEITDKTPQSLSSLPKLSFLGLRWNHRLTGACLSTLKNVKTLKYLEVRRQTLGAEGCDNIGTMNSLENLWLSDTKVGDDDFVRFAKLPNLNTLYMGGNPLTDASVPVFRSFGQLRSLTLDSTEISPAGFDKLAKELPNVKIRSLPN